MMSTMMFFLSGFMSVAAVDIDEDHLTKTVTSCSGKPVNDERANCCFSRCRDKYTGRNLRGEKIICRMRCKCNCEMGQSSLRSSQFFALRRKHLGIQSSPPLKNKVDL